MPEDEKLEEYIELIKDWLETQPKLHARKDRKIILRYLHGCKYDIEKVKTKMKKYYESKRDYPDIFSNRDPTLKDLNEIIHLGVGAQLPKTDSNGCYVWVGLPCLIDPYVHHFSDAFLVIFMATELLLETEDMIAVNGIRVIGDGVGATFKHLLQITPHLIAKYLHVGMNCLPIKVKSIDLIHVPWYARTLIRLLRSLLPSKLKRRFHVYGDDISGLKDFFPEDVLPDEYGGTGGPLKKYTDYWAEKLIENREWYLNEEKFKAE